MVPAAGAAGAAGDEGVHVDVYWLPAGGCAMRVLAQVRAKARGMCFACGVVMCWG